jgi:hypothetical protein
MRAPHTPSSLKWLITRRARLDGEIAKLNDTETNRKAETNTQLDKLRRHLEEALSVEKTKQTIHARTLAALKADLDATDLLLRQHEVGIEPSLIRPVRSQDDLALTDYGHLSRLIYRHLKEANGMPRTATQTAAFVALCLGYDSDSTSFFSDLRYRVRKRMQHLAWEGKITRVENQQGSIEGRWCLKHSQWANFEQESHPRDDVPANNLSTTVKSRS